MPSSKPQPGKSLAETHPELAAQADGWDPSTLRAMSNKKVGWKCALGHKWVEVIASRSRFDRGCRVCSDPRVTRIRAFQVGINDLATVNPELAAQADGWDPSTVAAWSNKKVGWKCAQGHKWKSALANRSNGAGCPVCSGRAVQIGFNDLATVNPDLAAQADGWDPTTLTAWSNKKVGWKCALGHKSLTAVTERSKGRGCAVCAGKRVLVGFNDLATINPELAAQAEGWDPTTLVASSNKKVGWKCEHNHKWKAKVSDRSRGDGCPSCAIGGYDPNKSGWLYFIDHDGLEMYQIGISNYPDDRLADHKGRGWEVIEIRGPMDGHLTQELEDNCLLALKKRGAVLGRKGSMSRFDGYTEAWTKKSLNVTSIKQILDWVHEDDDSSGIKKFDV